MIFLKNIDDYWVSFEKHFQPENDTKGVYFKGSKINKIKSLLDAFNMQIMFCKIAGSKHLDQMVKSKELFILECHIDEQFIEDNTKNKQLEKAKKH